MDKKRVGILIGIIFAIVQAVVTLMVTYKLARLNVLPAKYMVLVVIAFVVVLAGVIISQYFKIANIIGKVLSAIIIIALIFGYNVLQKTQDTMSKGIQSSGTTTVSMMVLTKTDNPAESLSNLAASSFGIAIDETNGEYDRKAVSEINKELGKDVKVVEYPDNLTVAKALINGDVDAMIINAAYTSTVDEAFEALDEESEGYLGKNDEGVKLVFSDFTKEVATISIEVEKKDNSGFKTEVNRELIDTAQVPFVLYVSGIDVKGDISTVSRSDVNVIVCVNPVTKTIAMVTTPRDSYVEIPGKTDNSSKRDKLTHAGLYGTGCEYSMATLENIYGVDIDYYLRVNFTSVVDIVDLLGGVTVHSDYEFYSRHVKEYIQVGDNFLNGEQALSFARERYYVPGGDYTRGKNHTELIKGVFKKAMSPSILANYSNLLELAADNIETNMAMDEITGLVKMQLNDGAEWNFVSYAAQGINGGDQQLRYTYSYADSKLYVTILDSDSVAKASEIMERVLNGEKLTQEKLDAELNTDNINE